MPELDENAPSSRRGHEFVNDVVMCQRSTWRTLERVDSRRNLRARNVRNRQARQRSPEWRASCLGTQAPQLGAPAARHKIVKQASPSRNPTFRRRRPRQVGRLLRQALLSAGRVRLGHPTHSPPIPRVPGWWTAGRPLCHPWRRSQVRAANPGVRANNPGLQFGKYVIDPSSRA